MDNHYELNLTMGPLVCAAIRPRTSAGIDVRLMVKPVDRTIPDFVKAGANWISFHAGLVLSASSQGHQLTPLLWKVLCIGNPLRSDLHNLQKHQSGQ